MTERDKPATNDSLDFHHPKNELARQARDQAETIRYWGLALAREKLGDEVVGQAWKDQAANPPSDSEFYQATKSQEALEEFARLELEPLLRAAYSDSSGDKADNIYVILDLLAGSLYISLDEQPDKYYLDIQYGLPLHFQSSSLVTKQSRFDKVKKIIDDMNAAFMTVLAR
jgi:hypothetical protein